MFPHTGTGGYVPCKQINRGDVPEAKSANRRKRGNVPDSFLRTDAGMNQ